LRAAMEYPWPGNLRELTSVVTALLTAPTPGSDELTAVHFHKALATHQQQRASDPAAVRLVTLDVVVQEHINSVLRACRGNKLRAAEVLGISRSTLYRMLDAAAVHAPLSMAS
jgi:transcriptional regulator of acetoin/glycerol metabolism